MRHSHWIAETNKWLGDVSDLLIDYCDKADKRWNDLDNESSEHHEKFVIRLPMDKITAKAEDQKILGYFATVPQLLSPLKNEKRPERELIVLEMYIKLGLWLCFYCIGSPQLSLWEEIKALAVRLKAYPGDAFFDKLVGDAYRAERLRLTKGNLGLFESKTEKSYAGLHVLAFTPIVVLPDDDTLRQKRVIKEEVIEEIFNILQISQDTTQTTEQNTTEVSNATFAESYQKFIGSTERLAHRYLRFQVWCYLRGSNYPLHYAVAQDSVIAAFNNLVDARLRNGGNIEDIRRDLRVESNARIRKFFGETLLQTTEHPPCRRLGIFKSKFDGPQELDTLVGLTSCALAPEDGVIASRSNRKGDWEDCCFYVEGLPLATEREKIKKLWRDVKQKGIEYIHQSDNFAEIWLQSLPISNDKNACA